MKNFHCNKNKRHPYNGAIDDQLQPSRKQFLLIVCRSIALESILVNTS